MTPQSPMPAWERQFCESPRQYQAFAYYRDLGPQRSIAKAYAAFCAATGKPLKPGDAPSTWAAWSSLRRWVQRAEAFDVHVEAAARRAREAKRCELATAREQFELEEQAHLQKLAIQAREKLEAALKAPNMRMRQTDYSEDGSTIVKEREVDGIRLTDIAGLIRAYLDAGAAAVNGWVRVTRSGKLPEPEDAAKDRAAAGPTGLVWERYPGDVDE